MRPGDHAEEIWTNAEERIAVRLNLDTGTGIHYVIVHGFDAYPWVVALNARFSVYRVSDALADLQAADTPVRLAVARVALLLPVPEHRAIITDLQDNDPSERIRRAASRALDWLAQQGGAQIRGDRE